MGLLRLLTAQLTASCSSLWAWLQWQVTVSDSWTLIGRWGPEGGLVATQTRSVLIYNLFLLHLSFGSLGRHYPRILFKYQAKEWLWRCFVSEYEAWLCFVRYDVPARWHHTHAICPWLSNKTIQTCQVQESQSITQTCHFLGWQNSRGC